MVIKFVVYYRASVTNDPAEISGVTIVLQSLIFNKIVVFTTILAYLLTTVA